MKYNFPNRINFGISEISFGGWQLGNSYDFNEMDENEAIDLVEQAVKSGITLFDTAPNYGHGNSEKLLGKALKPYRKKVFINTKFGHDSEGGSGFAIENLERSIRSSLVRLQTDYLDSVILHNPGREMLYGKHPIYDELNRLKSEGLIHFFGVSVDMPEELDIVLNHNAVDVIEVMFNIVHQSPKIWFDEIEKQGILLMIKVPFDSGWLTGKYNENTNFKGIKARWTKEVIKTRVKIVDKIKDIVGDDLVHASLRFILNYSAVTCVIPGTRNLKQLKSNLKTSHFKLDIEKQLKLEKLYEDYIQSLNTPW